LRHGRRGQGGHQQTSQASGEDSVKKQLHGEILTLPRAVPCLCYYEAVKTLSYLIT
jgi:hypothetical protein